jgi:hypothetical protein
MGCELTSGCAPKLPPPDAEEREDRMTLSEWPIWLRDRFEWFGDAIWACEIAVPIALLMLSVHCLRGWRRWISLAAAIAVPAISLFYSDGLLKAMAELYTYRLDRPRVLDGIAFPTGSTVRLSITPPHSLAGGNLAVPTEVLGLPLIGEFETSPPNGAYPLAIREGTLHANANIRGIPCGPGRFSNTGAGTGDWLASTKGEEPYSPDIQPYRRPPNTVVCTLAANVSVPGAVLRAGALSSIRLAAPPGEEEFSGELAAGALLRGIPCGRGSVLLLHEGVRCILARDHELSGVLLAAGKQVEAGQLSHPGFDGTLARPVRLLDVDIPAGSAITVFPVGDGFEFVGFSLAEGNATVVKGAALQGPLLVEIQNDLQRVYVRPDHAAGPGVGVIAFEGMRHLPVNDPRISDWAARFENGQWTFRDAVGADKY